MKISSEADTDKSCVRDSTGSYLELEAAFKRVNQLKSMEELLHWDREVLMPVGGAGTRAEQLAMLSVLAHQSLTDPSLVDQFAQAATSKHEFSVWQRANLREMKHQWRHANALPSRLVEKFSTAASKCTMHWRECRASNDFAALLPSFSELIKIVREVASVKSDFLRLPPYDALLDSYDSGFSRSQIDQIFDQLRVALPPLVDKVIAKQRRNTFLPLSGSFRLEDQRKLAEAITRALGLSQKFSRLDVSQHPFTAGVSDDIRITTRYQPGSFMESLMATIHETGHALYELHLPVEWRWQPVGQARGMTIHESMALLMEMQLSRSLSFLQFVLPLAREIFRGSGPSWNLENVLGIYHTVEPGLIRVEADEITYPLHILLRYDLEKALLSGDLVPKDLPTAWNDGMRSKLDIEVPSDSAGCMQDIHWYSGDFGYFPTYTLGALTAAQLFQAVVAQYPDIYTSIAKGDFRELQSWLMKNIYSQACLRPVAGLLKEATGISLSANPFLTHLTTRYLKELV